MNHPPPPPAPPRWLHWLALLTLAFTLPLLFLGAEVTTKRVGMADEAGYRHPWELVQVLAAEAGLDVQIEYSHRLAGFTVGTCAILLAAGLWLFERRRWVCWAGTLALGLICVQGLLGIFRVNLNELLGSMLALIHGSFAQLVIAALVSVALFTSRTWLNDHADSPAPAKVRRWALYTCLLVYGQLVLGGVLRHRAFVLGSRLHILGAFAVVAAALWLFKTVRDSDRRDSLGFATGLLLILIAAQVLLGVEAWMFRASLYYMPAQILSPATDLVRSAHYVLGTGIFATSVVIALRANRRTVVLHEAAPSRVLEGVA